MNQMWCILMCMAFGVAIQQVSSVHPQVHFLYSPLPLWMRSDVIEVPVTPESRHGTHESDCDEVQKKRAIVRLSDEKGGVMGVLHFRQQRPPNGPVHITGNITGLEPGKKGIHVHTNGDCIEAGLHFQQRHGLPDDEHRHWGDLGNILVSADGVAVVDITDDILSLNGARNMIGRSLIIDAVEDLGLPEGSPVILPTQAACGIIGFIKV